MLPDGFKYGLCLLILYSTKISQTNCSQRTWTPKNNFEDPSTWTASRAPCFGDNVILQEERAIVVSQHHSLSGLSFPTTGELIVAEGGVLDIVSLDEEQNLSRQRSSCPAGSSETLTANIKPTSWYDATNWKTEDSDVRRGRRIDSETIPCDGDDVIFPAGHTFHVTLPSTLTQPIVLRSLKIGSRAFTDELLSEYFSRPEVSIFFGIGDDNSSTIAAVEKIQLAQSAAKFLTIRNTNVAESQLVEEQGYKCGNDRREVMENLCKFVKAPAANCSEPVLADGQCFPFCGAVLRFKSDNLDAAISKVTELVRKLPEELLDAVTASTSVLNDGSLQTVLFPIPTEDSGYDSASVKRAADLLFAKLKNEDSFLVLENSVTVQSAGAATTGSHSHDKLASGQQGSSSGTLAGIIVAVISVLVILVGVLFFVWRRRRALPFAFRPFNEPEDETVEMNAGPTFHNPLYDAGRAAGTDQESLLHNNQDFINRNFMDFNDDELELQENEF